MRLVSVAPADVAGSGASLRLQPVDALKWAILLLVTTNLGNVPLLDMGGRSAPLFLSDAGVIFVVALGMATALRGASLQLDNVALAAVVFATIGGLTAVSAMPRFGLTAFELLASVAYLVRWVTYFGLYLVIINFARARDGRALWSALEYTILAFAVFGIVQSAFLPDFGPMMYPDAKLYAQVDPQGHRLVSTVLEPNIAAAMILVVLLVQLGQLGAGARIPAWKPAVLLLALVLTLSRSGALAFVVGVLVIVLALGLGRRAFRFFAAAVVVFCASLPVLLPFAANYSKLGINDGSATARFIVWQRAITVWLESPWFGIGFNTYGFVQERRGFERFGSATYSAEGGLLFVAVMTGIVGLLVFGVMLWFVIRRCRWIWRNRAADASERGFAAGVAAATIAVVVHSTFVNSLLVNFVMEELWVIWGLVWLTAAAIRVRTAQAA